MIIKNLPQPTEKVKRRVQHVSFNFEYKFLNNYANTYFIHRLYTNEELKVIQLPTKV